MTRRPLNISPEAAAEITRLRSLVLHEMEAWLTSEIRDGTVSREQLVELVEKETDFENRAPKRLLLESPEAKLFFDGPSTLARTRVAEMRKLLKYAKLAIHTHIGADGEYVDEPLFREPSRT